MRAWDFHVLLFYFVSFHLVIVWFVNYLSQFHFEIYLLIVPFMNGWTFVFRNLEYAVTKDATDHIGSHERYSNAHFSSIPHFIRTICFSIAQRFYKKSTKFLCTIFYDRAPHWISGRIQLRIASKGKYNTIQLQDLILKSIACNRAISTHFG